MTYASPNCVNEHHVHLKYGKQFQDVSLFPVRKAPLKLISNCLERRFPLRDYYCNHETRKYRIFTLNDLKEAKKLSILPAKRRNGMRWPFEICSLLPFYLLSKWTWKRTADGQDVFAPGSSNLCNCCWTTRVMETWNSCLINNKLEKKNNTTTPRNQKSTNHLPLQTFIRQATAYKVGLLQGHKWRRWSAASCELA